MELTPLSTLTTAMRADGDRFVITLPPDWQQGRTAYGGITAALCLEATQRAVADLPPLRSAQFLFIGPATGELGIDPNVLRRGKSTVVVGADVAGDSGLAARASLCFGAGRACAHEYAALDMPSLPGPDECPSYYVFPSRPNFMSHFEGRLAAGARPGESADRPEMSVWLRHRDEGDDSSLVRLLALADALPPAGLALYGGLIPISTMTWSIEMLDPAPTTATGWWMLQAAADTVHDGYSAQRTTIWSPAGKPVLIARQNVAIFG